MRGHDLLALSFRVIGALFAGIALVVSVATGVFVSRAARSVGTVVDYRAEQNAITFLQSSEQTGVLYYPIIEYSLGDGATWTITGRTGHTSRPYEIGDRVTVLANPSNPASARINTVMGIWGSVIVLGGLGALFLILSVLAPLGFGGSLRKRP